MKIKRLQGFMFGLLVFLLLATALSTWKRDVTGRKRSDTAVVVGPDREGRFSISVPDGRQQADTADERHPSVTNLDDVAISSVSTGSLQVVAPDIRPNLPEAPAVDSAMVEDKIPEPVSEAANSGLVPFLTCIPEQDLRHYGFSSKKEFADCSLEVPFKVYTITPDKILGFDGNTSLSSLISSTELWFFPITCGNQYRVLLTVDNVDDKWEAVAIGSSGLAGDLANIIATWPSSEGYNYKLVRVYQARSDFVAVFRDDETSLVPLTSASMMLGVTRESDGKPKPHDYKDIMQRLMPIVSQSLEQKY